MTQKTLNPILLKNSYLPSLIGKAIKKYHDYKFSSNQNQLKDNSEAHYFKLPYIDILSHHFTNNFLKLCKELCDENFKIKLVFNSFKIKNYFSYKNPIPNDLKSFLVYIYIYIYLLMPAVVPSILTKLGVILKLYVLGNYYDLYKQH